MREITALFGLVSRDRLAPSIACARHLQATPLRHPRAPSAARPPQSPRFHPSRRLGKDPFRQFPLNLALRTIKSTICPAPPRPLFTLVQARPSCLLPTTFEVVILLFQKARAFRPR